MTRTNVFVAAIAIILLSASYASAQCVGGQCYPQRIFQRQVSWQPMYLQGVVSIAPPPRRWVLGQCLGNAINRSVTRRHIWYAQPCTVPQYGPAPPQAQQIPVPVPDPTP